MKQHKLIVGKVVGSECPQTDQHKPDTCPSYSYLNLALDSTCPARAISCQHWASGSAKQPTGGQGKSQL